MALPVCALLIANTALNAQSTNGTLTGTVSDASGAVIPNATVVLTNAVAAGDERRTVTNNDGFFSINAVPPGDYIVTVEAKGFQKLQRTGVHFDAGDRRNLSDLTMQVGAATETVMVTGVAESITPVDSGEKSMVINSNLIQNVQIQGQNAAEFIKILPGFSQGGSLNPSAYNGQVQGTGSGPVGSFSANGLRTAALDITSDGAHIVDPGCNCGQAVNTQADMTQELKVLTSNFGADNAKGPVVISAVGKSGGSQFHGEAYLYARNSVFDANNAYDNSLGYYANGTKIGPKPDTYFYYPGGNISGPVLIPHTRFNRNRDKLFFFFAYEYYRQQTQDPSHDIFSSFVPTAEMRAGNFTQSYLNSVTTSASGYAITGAATSGIYGTPTGQIPANRINPTGLAMMNLYALPNTSASSNPGGYNYIYATTHSDNMWQIRPRIDWSINDNTKLFVSYNGQRELNHNNSTEWWGTNPTVPYPSPLQEGNTSDSISANLTKVFTPTLTNEFIFTYTNLYVPNTFVDPAKVDPKNVGINYHYLFNNQPHTVLPVMTGWSDGVANMLNPSGFQAANGNLYANKWLPTIADNVSWVKGTHTMKFGYYWEHTKNQQPSDSYQNGEFQFANWNQGSTGNAYADMLTGIITGYNESNYDYILPMHYTSVAFFGMDSWKVTRRFTLDYGLRFDHLGPWTEDNNVGAAVFIPSLYDPKSTAASLTGFTWHAKDSSIPNSGTGSRAFFYNPRFGFAWDIFGSGKTVVRGGVGWYRYHDEQNVQAAGFGTSAGSFTYSVPNPANNQPLTFASLATLTPGTAVPGTTSLDPHDNQQPETRSYSFTISQRMPWSSLFEISYVGNQARYLNNWNNNFGNLNALPYGTLFTPQNLSLFGTPASVAACMAGGKTKADCVSNSPATTTLQPYPLYGSIHEIIHTLYSNYNSLQASWNKQSGRVNYLVNYTFSKALGIRGEGGNNGVGDQVNINNSYGVLPNDRTQVFNAAYIIQLPDPIHGNRLLKGVVNGWQISGVTQIESGTPLQGQVSSNFGMSGTILPGSPGSVLPNGLDISGLGVSAQDITGTPNISAQPVVTCDPRKGLKSNQFINGNCLAPPSPGHNGSFVLPYVKTPAFWNTDISLFKNFQLSEYKKIQFRVSAYNFINHPLTAFSPAAGSNDSNLILSFDSTGKLTNKNFGFADYLYGARSVQFVFKFYF
ncbi:MAG TPA: carboxypeptidase regulatory-like domain-containing protein [Bryobacteraceae bacterium]|jgi:hypothetical protein|nr:carboxypeptidase regulatory-like domain-containing protein [Bryobacteraceae bacterium]